MANRTTLPLLVGVALLAAALFVVLGPSDDPRPPVLLDASESATSELAQRASPTLEVPEPTAEATEEPEAVAPARVQQASPEAAVQAPASTGKPGGPRLHGRILERSTGLPLAGVRIARRPVSYVEGITEEEALATTDAHGRFWIQATPSAGEAMALAHHPDYSWITFGSDEEHQDPAAPLELTMSRAAWLDVHVAGPGLAAGDLISIETSARNLQQPPNTWNPSSMGKAMGSSFNLTWPVELDADGRALVEVPSNVVLQVKLRSGGEWREHPPVKWLPSGSTRTLEWTFGHGAQVSGLLLDQHGAPIPGAKVWLGKRILMGPMHFMPAYVRASGSSFEQQAVTDEAGRFVFEGVASGQTMLAAAPAPPRVELDPITDHARIARYIEVPEGVAEVTQDLETYRGLYATGRLIAPGHTGPWLNRLSTTAATGGNPLSTVIAEDGSFVIGPMKPGEHTIRISGSLDGLGAPDRIPVQAGDRDLEVQLEEGGGLRGLTRSATTSEPIVAMVKYTREGSRTTAGVYSLVDGTFDASDLAPGCYGLLFTDDEDRIATLQDIEIEAGAELDVGDIMLEDATELTVTFTGTSATGTYSVLQGDVLITRERVQAVVPTITSVPSGVITVLVERPGAEADPHVVQVLAGVDAELTIDLL